MSAPPQIIRFQTLRTLALEGKAWLPCAPKLLLTETPSLFFLIEVQLINNIVLVSGVQQSDSVIHISFFFFKFLFPFRLLLFSHQVVSDSLQPHGNILGFPVPPISHSLPKFVSIESVMLSNHLILCCPLLLLPSNLSQHQSLFQ